MNKFEFKGWEPKAKIETRNSYIRMLDGAAARYIPETNSWIIDDVDSLYPKCMQETIKLAFPIEDEWKDYFEEKIKEKEEMKQEINYCGFTNVPSRGNAIFSRKPNAKIEFCLDNLIEKVIFNDPATIVIWKDGTKTVVKVQDDEMFDPYIGLAMCISKKAMGNKGSYMNVFKKWCDPWYEEEYNNIGTPVNDLIMSLAGVFVHGRGLDK